MRFTKKSSLLLMLLLAGTSMAFCQTDDQNSLGAEFSKEYGSLKGNCFKPSFKQFGGCMKTIAMDPPLHLAFGSIAPQNGFSSGLAFVHHRNPSEAISMNFNTDAVVSTNQSWRAGSYVKIVWQDASALTSGEIKNPTAEDLKKALEAANQTEQARRPILNLYTQATSLNKLVYFGPGQTSSTANRTFFGLQESITGINGILPMSMLHSRLPFLSLNGEINGRTIDVRGRHGDTSPSIETRFAEGNTPGLVQQPEFIEFGEGIRLKTRSTRFVLLDYSARLQHFHALGNPLLSFRRFTLDLSHEIPLYSRTKAKENNGKKVPAKPLSTGGFLGPDDAFSNAGPDQTETRGDVVSAIPSVTRVTRNLQGSIGLRAMLVESIAHTGGAVPFYFQPTLGGSDINGEQRLPSYADYRFRAPNMLLGRATFEHSIYWIFGVAALADVGKVAATRGDLELKHLRHSFAVGFTVRAGNLPKARIMFAWGGREGTHTIGYIDPQLLAGTSRPSLY